MVIYLTGYQRPQQWNGMESKRKLMGSKASVLLGNLQGNSQVGEPQAVPTRHGVSSVVLVSLSGSSGHVPCRFTP